MNLLPHQKQALANLEGKSSLTLDPTLGKTIAMPRMLRHSNGWDIHLNGRWIARVYFQSHTKDGREVNELDVKFSLVVFDGYDSAITVQRA